LDLGFDLDLVVPSSVLLLVLLDAPPVGWELLDLPVDAIKYASVNLTGLFIFIIQNTPSGSEYDSKHLTLERSRDFLAHVQVHT
jgi:hypothetical protein